MSTTTETYYVLDNGSRAMHVNDEIRQPLLCASRAHAARIIKWLGLVGYKIRAASQQEVDTGMLDTAKASRGVVAAARVNGVEIHE